MERQAQIRQRGSTFQVEGLPGARVFADLASAQAWAEAALSQELRHLAGPEPGLAISLDAEDRTVRTSQQQPLFLGRVITARLHPITA
jgi:hypothetical protein